MKISIITASYNYEQYIPKCIESVMAQSYQDWELVVVDDASSDNSVEIIKSYCEKDDRIKLVCHDKNKGLKQTLLTGLEHATGDWIAFLESDDTFMPDNLLKKVEVIEKNPDIKLIFNKVEFVGDEKKSKKVKKDLTPTLNELSKTCFPKNMFYDFYLKNMILTFSCVMVKKNILQNTSFDTPTDALLDWWLWIHLAYDNVFYYIKEELTSWNIHPESYISNSKKPILNLTQLNAYLDIYKNNGKNFKILLFLAKFTPILILIRIKKLFVKIINRLLILAR